MHRKKNTHQPADLLALLCINKTAEREVVAIDADDALHLFFFSLLGLCLHLCIVIFYEKEEVREVGEWADRTG
jgi:hypothetical protein